DGAVGMGSLGQCNEQPRHAQTTSRRQHIEDEQWEAKALLLQPFRVHRPTARKKRPASRTSVIKELRMLAWSRRSSTTTLTIPCTWERCNRVRDGHRTQPPGGQGSVRQVDTIGGQPTEQSRAPDRPRVTLSHPVYISGSGQTRPPNGSVQMWVQMW